MKNKLAKFIALFLSLVAITAFSVACAPQDNGENQTPPEHVHSYSTEYSFDDEYHWFECECGEKTESQAHIITNEKCVCGYEEQEEQKPTPDTPEHTHNFNKTVAEEKYLKAKASCTKKAEYYYSCECGEKGQTVFESGVVLDHSFTDYADNGDDTMTALCDYGCGTANTVEKGHEHDYKTSVTEPTCEEKGYTTYTCSCGDSYKADYVDELSHSYGNWDSNGDDTHTRECANDSNHKETKPCAGGKATCENKAVCTDCEQEYGKVLGHDYEGYVDNEDGTHTSTCKNDNNHKKIEECEDNGSGECVLCGASLLKVYVREGDKIYFGSYPQTEVNDSALKSTLNGLAGELPTSSNSGNWISYEYYISGVVKDYMWYIDLNLDGEKYRGVYFNEYRPTYTNGSSSRNSSQQDENGFMTGSVYWFIYEPIEWEIIKDSGSTVFIVSTMALDSQAYQNEVYYENGDYYTKGSGIPSGTYANSYKFSTIRSWLNDNFYNTAFGKRQKQIILTTEVDNSEASTSEGLDPFFKNPYACENTFDKVFLLSKEDTRNSEFGFVSNASRRLVNTSYAKAQGCYAHISNNSPRSGPWWLRSPYSSSGEKAYCISYDGYYYDKQPTNYVNIGVVPAMQIQL